MSNAITQSLIWHLCGVVFGWIRKSFLGRFAGWLIRSWQQSAIYGLFARLLTKDSAVERSGLYGLTTGINNRVHSMGSGLRKGYGESFLGTTLIPAVKNSFLLGSLLRNGFTSVLLFFGGSYAIIDYLLRDVFQIAAFASVWDEAYMLLCLGWLILRMIKDDKPVISRANSSDLLVGFYLVVGLVLFICTSVRVVSIHITGFRASMQYLLMFFLTVRLIRDDKDFMRLYRLLVAIATLLALYGIYQYIIGVEIPVNWTDSAEGSVRTRVFAIFSNPNVMGGYMILFAPMAIGMAYAEQDVGTKVLYWFCGLSMCAACLFTMSRGAWLGLAVAAVLFSLVVDKKLFFLLLVGGILSCFLPFVQSRIGYLFTPAFRESNQRAGRGVRWERAFGYVSYSNAWPMGLGYGMYGGAVAMQNQINPNYTYTYVDNYYVKIIAENGIAGITGLLTMLAGLFWNGGRACARNADNEYKPLCAGMLMGLVGFMVQSFFECLWEEPYLMALFFIVAAMMIYAGFHREKATAKK